MDKYIKKLQELNQICKGLNDKSTYVLDNGIVYSHSMDNEKKKNCAFVKIERADGEPILEDIDYRAYLKGSDIYAFIKNNNPKKIDVNKVINPDGSITITSASGDKLDLPISKGKGDRLLKKTKKYIRAFQENKAINIDITDTAKSSLKRAIPLLIQFTDSDPLNLGEEKEISFRFTKKLIKTTFNDKISYVKFSTHSTNGGLYIANIQIEKSGYIINQYYYYIPY